MILTDNFCGCNSYEGCTCSQENQFFSYTGSGTFPMKKGTRGDHVKALQIALNTKFNTPATLRIITPTDYWGDKTEALMKYHNLPTEIPNAQVLQQILEGKNPNLASGQSVSSNTSANTWASALKDPNQAIGLFGQVSSIVGNFRNQSQQRPQGAGNFGNFEVSFGERNTDLQGGFGMQTQQPQRIPTAAWLAIGLVGLLFIGFLVYKIAK